jgi:hypothetical protein
VTSVCACASFLKYALRELKKAISIKRASSTRLQTLGTRNEWNKCCDIGMRMRQLSKIRSQYERTVRVWASFNLIPLCNELWIAFTEVWYQWPFVLFLEAEFPFETVVPPYRFAMRRKLERNVSSTWLPLVPAVATSQHVL